MRLYPKDSLNLHGLDEKMEGYKFSKSKDTLMLTRSGIYKNINDSLYIYKFNFKEKDKYIKNYIENYDFILTPNKWIKIEERYQMPTVYHVMNTTKMKYLPREKAPVAFICEFLDGELRDYYFEIKEDAEDLLIKEDVCSFLSRLI
jgi:hypothetical protein